MGAGEGREKQKPVSQQGRARGFSDRNELRTFQCLCFLAEPEVRITQEDAWGRGSGIQLLKHQGHRSSWPDTHNQDLLRP